MEIITLILINFNRKLISVEKKNKIRFSLLDFVLMIDNILYYTICIQYIVSGHFSSQKNLENLIYLVFFQPEIEQKVESY